jgi:2-aminoadipate transaminase
LRLSFVTLVPADIAEGVATLGRVLREHLDGTRDDAP